MANPTPGTALGAYRVDATLGAGSMGEVYLAVDTSLNRKVAIKLLSEKHRDSRELRARFVREGRAVAAISHPNVVQVFATGTFDERPYIAMELLDGKDLGSIVEKHGPLGSVEAAQAVLDAALGLAAAARAGLIHRDVKPSNLVRIADGSVKVTDFGLAKPVDPGAEPALTAMGVVVGTPDYIAPEQARGEKIDERVDIYALGGTLYFLLAGVPPFRTGKPAEDKYLKVVARHLRNPAPDATARRPEVDRELAELAMRMMAKEPGARPGYGDLVAHLGAIIGRLDPSAVVAPPPLLRDRGSRPVPVIGAGDVGARLAGADDDLGQPTVAELELPRPSVPGWAWVVTVGAVLVFVIGLVMLIANRGHGGGAAPAPAGAGSAAPTTAPAPTGSAGDGEARPAGARAQGARAGTADLRRPGLAGASDATGGAADGGVARPPAAADADEVIVRHGDGRPWFAVDPTPVSVASFRRVFGGRGRPLAAPSAAMTRAGGDDGDGPGAAGAADDDHPVVEISYDEARAFARARGGRLLRSDEWEAASTRPGFRVADGALEWLESPGPRHAARQHGRSEQRPDAAQPDVTFRVARDL